MIAQNRLEGSSMKYKPHDYQAYATNFILEHPISAVFLDMGLGKSVITLSAIFDLCLDYHALFFSNSSRISLTSSQEYFSAAATKSGITRPERQ